MLTIIGAESFHGPVRDGKGWFQLAMVIRRRRLTSVQVVAQPLLWLSVSLSDGHWKKLLVVIAFANDADKTMHLGWQGYRVKPHGQLVLVSLTCYHASTPSLSTSWSRTTL